MFTTPTPLAAAPRNRSCALTRGLIMCRKVATKIGGRRSVGSATPAATIDAPIPSPRADLFHRAVRWLWPATLLTVAPKCLLCVLVYAGLAGTVGIREIEICDPSAGSPNVSTTTLAWLGLFSGLLILFHLMRHLHLNRTMTVGVNLPSSFKLMLGQRRFFPSGLRAREDIPPAPLNPTDTSRPIWRYARARFFAGRREMADIISEQRDLGSDFMLQGRGLVDVTNAKNSS